MGFYSNLKVAYWDLHLTFYERNAIITRDEFNLHMAQCKVPRAQVRLFFGLHLYLAVKYCENLKVPGAQLNVNTARAIAWFVGVTIYCTFFNDN